ncbi:MAG: phospho-sugar mutase, partial [Clostridia bacterium]|nr:phospho-sugar mutase [Clostridia bacterium]
MSREFCMETAGVLATEGIKAYVFENLRPTPELSFAVRYCHAVGGVMITASHNPPEYNGYKIYDEHGCQQLPRCTDVLMQKINEIDPLSVPAPELQTVGDLIQTLGSDVDEAYYRAVLDIRLREVDAKSLKIVYSPQHGTGNVPVREVLKRAGYRIIPVEEQCFPDRDFINTKSPNPENKEAYEMALEYAKREGADIAITTDPDCDRLGVVAKKNGEYALLTGNQSGALLLQYILSYHKEQGTLPANAVMCNTIVTSTLGDRVCEQFGVAVEKTLTGFKFIGDKIREWEENSEKTYVFGYEESYGCLIADFARDKDGVQASLMLCEAAAYYKSKGQSLWDVLDELYRTHGYFLDAVTAQTLTGADGAEKIRATLTALRNDPPAKAGDMAVVRVEDYLSPEMREQGFGSSNMLRFLLDDGSWVAVRPSGTEPKCKYYYCVRGRDAADAKRKHAQLRASFEK